MLQHMKRMSIQSHVAMIYLMQTNSVNRVSDVKHLLAKCLRISSATSFETHRAVQWCKIIYAINSIDSELTRSLCVC
jgi:ABC-type glutathione transport system ATPase component